MVGSSGVYAGAFQEDFSYQKGLSLEAAYLVIVRVSIECKSNRTISVSP